MRIFLVKIGIVFFFTVNIIFLYWVNQPAAPVRTTMGSVAEKNANFSYRRVIVTNAILGERVGKYIRFKSTIESRYDVVISLSDPETVPADCTVFRGYCYGLRDEAPDDCPFDAPFILIEFGQPGQ